MQSLGARGEAPYVPAIPYPYALHTDEVIANLKTSIHGLSQDEAVKRLEQFGPNTFPRAEPPSIVRLFFRQFLSPLIYVLLIAAAVSLLLEEWSDTGFILAVLIINAVIGTYQEYSAQKSAAALKKLVTTQARVLRRGDTYVINAEGIVPGDIVLLNTGSRIPADMRLIDSQGLEIDESLLTGESVPVIKDAHAVLGQDIPLGDRINMTFAGSMVTRGRGRGIVIATALGTEVGGIAASVLAEDTTKPPLLIRMERFTFWIAMLVIVAVAVLAVASIMRGMPLSELFMLAVALAISAIPEGLPVALTVALAVGMHRMAKRNVIVRRLVAVEALGSCTIIASDKTGTLTVNELTVQRIALPGQPTWHVSGEGSIPEGRILHPRGSPSPHEQLLLEHLCQSVVLCNEGFISRREGAWMHQGDAVDVALLAMAHKADVIQPEVRTAFPQLAAIPYESERGFCATLNQGLHGRQAFIKGAFEHILAMCSTMATPAGDVRLDHDLIERQAHELASQGFRVLAVASGPIDLQGREVFSEEHLVGMRFLGLVGMIDPLRPEVKPAVAACRDAGIKVCMITGDHPLTAYAIAKELEMVEDPDQVVTGAEFRDAELQGQQAVDSLTAQARVFARVEPHQKLDIVNSLVRCGHFVAVTGDGANDAPALRAAHVGVAMGKSGTDVARETAELVLIDDNFASIVSGVEEGRVAYANVRKVIFLLISTGAAELVLFALALFAGLPLPLLAVQLLWLNLVTNGIQDVALAFEPAEGDELKRAPRSPKEPIFNRLMIERVVVSALTIGVIAFAAFQWMLEQGYSVEEARNGTLLLMVLFENVHVFNSRAELKSAFRHNPLRNRLLLFGTVAAQLIHIGAMYTPLLSDVLGVQPISLAHWFQLLGLALILLIVMELQKLMHKMRVID